MAIPSLPQYTGYTLERSLEHPDCYVGLYYETATYQVSEPHTLRVATFNKFNLVEIDTAVYSMDTRWSHFTGPLISDFNSILWSGVVHDGTWSWSLDGGTITKIADAPRQATNYVIDIAETKTHIFSAEWMDGIYIYEKTGYGTINNTPVYTHTNVGESNQFNYVAYCPDIDVVSVRIHNNGGWNVNESINTTTFAVIDTFSTQNLGVYGGVTTFIDNDTRSSYHSYVTYTREGELRLVHLNSDGTYGSIENYDPDAGNVYEDLIAAKNIHAWYDFNEDDLNTKVLDRSGSGRDMTISGAFARLTSIISNNSDSKSIALQAATEISADTDILINSANSCIEVWVSYQETNGGTIGWSNTDGNSNGQMIQFGSDNTIRHTKWDGSGNTIIGKTVALNNVAHVVAQQTTNGMEIWVNGELIATNTSTTEKLSNYTRFWINPTGTSVNGIQMTVDEVIVYQDTLTKSEIRDRYNARSDTPLTGTYRERILSLNPIAYYPMDDVSGAAKDISGNGEHASLVSGTATYDASGGLVDGDNCISLPDANNTAFRSDNKFTLTNKMSVEFWGKKTADHVGGESWDIWFCLQDQATLNVEYFGFNYTNTYCILRSRDSAGVSTIQEVWNEVAELGEWFHVVVTIDDTVDEGHMYINGILVATCPTKPMETNPYLFFANYGDAGNAQYGPYGFMQHLSLYDKVLTPQEIADNYALGRGHTPTVVNAYEQAIIDDDPICYFPLDETTGTTVSDRMGRCVGTINGGSADTMTTTGLISGESQPCLNFDGSTQYIRVEGSQLVGRWSEFTVEAIINQNTSPAYATIFGPYNTDGYYFAIQNTTGVRFGVSIANANWNAFTTSTPMQTNKTYHLVGTFDGRYLSVYINGLFVGQLDIGSNNTVFYDNVTHFTIGEQDVGGPVKFDGKIAHCAVYDKVLTQSQISNHANLALGYNASDIYNKIVADAPIVYVPMQDSSTAQDDVRDIIGGKNLDVVGTLTFDSISLVDNDGGNDVSIDFPATGTDYIDASNLAGIIANNSDFSYEIIVQSDTETPSSDFIFEMSHTANGREGVSIYKSDAGFGIRVSDSDVNSFHTTGITTANEPVHLVVTYQAGVGYKYYVNGVLILDETTIVPTTSTFADANEIFIGASYTNVDNFDGKMSHFALYDYTLTSDQISDHYYATKGIPDSTYRDTIKALAPIRYFRCDDDAGSTTLRDESFRSANSTVTGGIFESTGAIISEETNRGVYFGYNELAEITKAETIPYNGDWTLEFWCKVVEGESVVISQGRDTFGSGWSVAVFVNSGSFGINLITTSPSTAQQTFSYPADPGTDVWNHIVFVWEEGVGMSGYINGHNCGQIANTTSVLRDSTKGLFLNESNNGDSTNESYFDEIAIYDYLLTDADIINNYLVAKGITDSYESQVLTSSPAVRWRLDDDTAVLKDVFGNATYTSLNTTPNGPALHRESNGSTQFLGGDNDSGRYADTILGGRTTWTIEAWVQFNASGVTQYLYTESGGGGITLQFKRATNDKIYVTFHTGVDWADDVFTDFIVPNGVPLHIVWVRNGITSTIYVNGKVAKSGSHGATYGADALDAANTNSAIGANAATGSTYDALTGYLDDVCIYNDVLTAQEVEDHYYKGVLEQINFGSYIASLNPEFYLKFNKITNGSVVQDEFDVIGITANGVYVDESTSALSDGSFRIPDGGYVSFPLQDYHNIAADGEFTMMCWFRLDGSTGQSQRIMDFRGTGTPGTEPGIQMSSTNDATGLSNSYIDDGAGNYAKISGTDYGIDDGFWHHAVFTWNAVTQEMKLYLDGDFKEIGAVTGTVGSVTPNLEMRFGRAADGTTGQNMIGHIDDALIFTSELSASTIAEIYARTQAKYKIDGYVTQDGIPVKRKIRIYNRATGALVKETTSNIGGIFTMDFKEYDQNEYYAIALDDDDGPSLDAIVHDRLTALDF